jgi:hypothetical protein
MGQLQYIFCLEELILAVTFGLGMEASTEESRILETAWAGNVGRRRPTYFQRVFQCLKPFPATRPVGTNRL